RPHTSLVRKPHERLLSLSGRLVSFRDYLCTPSDAFSAILGDFRCQCKPDPGPHGCGNTHVQARSIHGEFCSNPSPLSLMFLDDNRNMYSKSHPFPSFFGYSRSFSTPSPGRSLCDLKRTRSFTPRCIMACLDHGRP
ncbi:hypothetical protein Hypma_000385, partial [Hypsizygus marmoreus]